MHTRKYGLVLAVCALSACVPQRHAEMISGNTTLYSEKGRIPNSERGRTPKAAMVQSQRLPTSPATPVVAETGHLPATIAKQPSAKIASWEIRGALAARNNKKGWSATLNWVQHGPNAYQIRLNGPLGNGAVMISKQGGYVTFKDGPRTSTSTNGEELLYKQTGTKLPIDNLYYWVRGLPAPGEIQSQSRDSANHLASIHQDGYTVQFMEYTNVNGTALPSAIRLQGRDLMVKVMIKRWVVN